MLPPESESKAGRRSRLALTRRAQWAHVKKRGSKRASFKRYWRYKSGFRKPRRDLTEMSRHERRALARSMWKTQQAIQKRGVQR